MTDPQLRQFQEKYTDAIPDNLPDPQLRHRQNRQSIIGVPIPEDGQMGPQTAAAMIAISNSPFAAQFRTLFEGERAAVSTTGNDDRKRFKFFTRGQ